MARSIETIKEEIIKAIMNEEVLVNVLKLDTSIPFKKQTSRSNLIGFMAYAVAVAIFTLEKLFDQFKTDVDSIVSELKPHSLRWYNEKIKAFQKGYTLPYGNDTYEIIDESDDVQIIKFSSVDEVSGKLLMKVAKTDDSLNPIPLSNEELDTFKIYMSNIKDAGVPLNIKSLPGDCLRLSLDIYYDPLVLNDSGGRLDGQDDAPIQKTVRNFIKNLPFNGVFIVAHLVDALQATEGVKIPKIISCETKYDNVPYSLVNAFCKPDAGYLKLIDEESEKENLEINWIPYV